MLNALNILWGENELGAEGRSRDWHSELHSSQFVHFLEGQLITLEVKKSVQDTLFKSEMGADMTVWCKPWEYEQ